MVKQIKNRVFIIQLHLDLIIFILIKQFIQKNGRIIKNLQRKARTQTPRLKDANFNRKSRLGKGVTPKYFGQSIAQIMKKNFGKGKIT